VLQDVIRLSSQQQQQQQDWRVCARLLYVLGAIPVIWEVATRACPAMVRTIIPAALPLLQQLQRCGQLLPTATVAPHVHSSRTTSSSSLRGSRDTGISLDPHQAYITVQQSTVRFVFELVGYITAQRVDSSHASCQLLRDPAVSELLLQLLAARTVILHKEHVAHRQQQQDPAAGSSSSSSSHSQQRPVQGAKQQLRADLLSIPAFHQHPDMLQLLPGGQAYLDAAAAWAGWKQQTGITTLLLTKSLQQAYKLQESLIHSLTHTLIAQHSGETFDATAPVLSAAAVRLVLQLQLLAASFVQRARAAKQQQQQELQQQQQQQQEQELQQQQFLQRMELLKTQLLLQTNYLLQTHIRSVLQCTGSSSLQPEVLQQAGLQLLQALAAPLQQLQLSSPSDMLSGMVKSWVSVGDRVAQQLFALQAAAAGMSQMTPSTSGKPCATAAAVVNGLALSSTLCSDF
jgi:hypothetical protein